MRLKNNPAFVFVIATAVLQLMAIVAGQPINGNFYQWLSIANTGLILTLFYFLLYKNNRN